MRCSLVLFGFGKSNSASIRIELPAADEAVDGAPVIVRRSSFAGGPPALQIQIAGDKQQRIAQRFHIQPPPVGAPQQPVLRIRCEVRRPSTPRSAGKSPTA